VLLPIVPLFNLYAALIWIPTTFSVFPGVIFFYACDLHPCQRAGDHGMSRQTKTLSRSE
jgi:hypothetical protein